jgi:hypothetical protein
MYLPSRRRFPACIRPAPNYRLQLPFVRLEPERPSPEVGSRQLLGFRLRHGTPSFIDGGVEISVHELHVLPADG